MTRVEIEMREGGKAVRCVSFCEADAVGFKSTIAHELKAAGAPPEALEECFEAFCKSDGGREYRYRSEDGRAVITATDGILPLLMLPFLGAVDEAAALRGDSVRLVSLSTDGRRGIV